MAQGYKTGGRKKGTPNKNSAVLKEAILMAATNAGQGDIVRYLEEQAKENPGPFMALLGKILPTEVMAEITTTYVHRTPEPIAKTEEWATQHAPLTLQ